MKPTDMYKASSTCMGNYAETNLPGQQFNFKSKTWPVDTKSVMDFYRECIHLSKKQIFFGNQEAPHKANIASISGLASQNPLKFGLMRKLKE